MSNDGTNTPDPYGQPDYGRSTSDQPDYGQPNPYGQQPGYAAPAATGPIEQPSSIKSAVLLMRIGALLSLVSLLSVFLLRDAMREAVEEPLRSADPAVTTAMIDTALTVALGLAVFSALLSIALWLWMASANGKGYSWARIVASVLFGISVLFTLIGMTQPQSGVQLFLALASLVLGGVIIFLLWKKESTDYYNSVTASRVMR